VKYAVEVRQTTRISRTVIVELPDGTTPQDVSDNAISGTVAAHSREEDWCYDSCQIYVEWHGSAYDLPDFVMSGEGELSPCRGAQ
jgi:hypothetical protein